MAPSWGTPDVTLGPPSASLIVTGPEQREGASTKEGPLKRLFQILAVNDQGSHLSKASFIEHHTETTQVSRDA